MLEEATKREIYEALTQKMSFGIYPMASVFVGLINAGHSHKNYGFVKGKQLLMEMPECFEILTEGRPATEPEVRFFPWGDAETGSALAAEQPQTAHPPTELGEAAKREIYEALAQQIGFGLHPMASVFVGLSNAGHSHKNYGFVKGKQLLLAMPECFEILTEGRPATEPEVRFFPWGDTEAGNASAAGDGESAFAAEGMPPQHLALLDQPLSSFANFPFKTISLLAQKTGIEPRELPARLDADFAAARRDGALQYYEQKLNFPFSAPSLAGNPLAITLRESSEGRGNGRPWFLSYIYENTAASRGSAVPPGRMLERFAFLGNWHQFLETLSQLALPECWDFGGQSAGGYSILRSYIQYTFARLQREGKVAIAEDGSLAAFNTGLVNPHYEDIYACFEPNNGGGQSAWRFTEFCIAGRRGLGKQLVSLFNPLPETASYFARKEDLLFDLNKPLLTDFEHIIVENVHRLPLDFLEEQCYGEPEARELVAALRGAPAHERAELYDQLRELVSETVPLYNRLKNRVEDAIKFARKMVRWNFKTALPSYYPTADTMSLMLPLYLRCDEQVDNVLVVELTPSGNYQGQTILTPQQAYVDARLVCRPNSDWLAPMGWLEGEEDEEA